MFEVGSKVKTSDGRVGTVKERREADGDSPEARYNVRYDQGGGAGWWPEHLLSEHVKEEEQSSARVETEGRVRPVAETQPLSPANKRSFGE